MANLDDFFAKKDKKKSKAKPKFLTPEELVKNLEESKKEAALAKAKKNAEAAIASADSAATTGGVAEEVNNASENNTAVEEPVEEEWKDFEQEQRKDYSGLKIAQLTINDDKQQSPTDVDDNDENSENISLVDLNKNSGYGPWKKLIPAEDVTQIPVEIEREKPSKAYISPAFRQMQQQGSTGSSSGAGNRSSRSRTAPDITNSDFFPTLNAARPEEQRKKKNEPAFEEVRHGGRVQRVQNQVATAPTAASNRFESLYDEDS